MYFSGEEVASAGTARPRSRSPVMRSPALADEQQMVVKPEKEKEKPEVAENPP